jgi:hypothetical protein
MCASFFKYRSVSCAPGTVFGIVSHKISGKKTIAIYSVRKRQDYFDKRQLHEVTLAHKHDLYYKLLLQLVTFYNKTTFTTFLCGERAKMNTDNKYKYSSMPITADTSSTLCTNCYELSRSVANRSVAARANMDTKCKSNPHT